MTEEMKVMVNTILEEMERMENRINRRFDKMDQRFEKIEQRMYSMQHEINACKLEKDAVSLLIKRMDQLEERIAS